MHADHNVALGFRSSPRDRSISGSATLLMSGSSLFSSPSQPPVAKRLDALYGVLELAQMFQVPIIYSRMVMADASSEVLQASAKRSSELAMFDRTTPNLLHYAPLRQRLESLNRHVLLFCGTVLEVDIQLSAMTALKRGFEVHLLTDACVPRAPDTAAVLLQGMAAAGVQLSSVSTLAGQLLADVTDASLLPLLALLKRLEAGPDAGLEPERITNAADPATGRTLAHD